jgi:uncharacterized membrane protein
MTRKKKKQVFKSEDLGAYVFAVGLAIAFIAAFFSMSTNAEKIVTGTLIVLGIVIGFLNISQKETVPFLVSSLVLVLVTGPFLGLIGQVFFTSKVLVQMFTYLIAFVVPAALIVTLKTIFITAKDEE